MVVFCFTEAAQTRGMFVISAYQSQNPSSLRKGSESRAELFAFTLAHPDQSPAISSSHVPLYRQSLSHKTWSARGYWQSHLQWCETDLTILLPWVWAESRDIHRHESSLANRLLFLVFQPFYCFKRNLIRNSKILFLTEIFKSFCKNSWLTFLWDESTIAYTVLCAEFEFLFSSSFCFAVHLSQTGTGMPDISVH